MWRKPVLKYLRRMVKSIFFSTSRTISKQWRVVFKNLGKRKKTQWTFKVKNVFEMYSPIFYYPTKHEYVITTKT